MAALRRRRYCHVAACFAALASSLPRTEAGTPDAQALHTPPRRTLQAIHDGELPDPSSVGWPPVACTEARQHQGVLALLCKGESDHRSLWGLGRRLLGEEQLTVFAARLKRVNARLAGRATSFWVDSADQQAEATFHEDFRGRWNFRYYCKNLNSTDWLIDVGGHFGETAIDAQLRAPRAHILTIEPSPWNFWLTRLNILENLPRGHNTVAIRGALGRTIGQMTGKHPFHRSWWSADRLDKQSVDARTGADFAEFNATLIMFPMLVSRLRMQRIQLLKLNCLGCEWAVALQLWRLNLWDKVRWIVGMINPVGPTLLQGQKVNIQEYLPDGIDLPAARLVFRLLCKTHKSYMPMCVHRKLQPLCLEGSGTEDVNEDINPVWCEKAAR
eukprot:TRINITY_DN25087_c0_g1_i1.p1 TRINITY_DN25087_c0_g1~~TRINITY_DN25087_c0_g1_i1.p1  ORF type:complete len:386 (-),score=65.95 TRINITY_DN25087_c0_g1_i1:291-1448(-)